MTNLTYTPTIDRARAAGDQAVQIPPAGPDLGVLATEDPFVSLQSEARWYGNSLWEFLVPAEATGGKLSVFQATMPEGFSPPRHIHTREDEVFMVEEGEALFDVDGRILTAGPGTTVFMPRGVPHTFRVLSPVARMLGVMTPGGFEELFRNLGMPASGRTLPPAGAVPFDLPAVMAEQERLGTRVVGAPLSGSEA